jgi:hypothetical protein
LEVLRICCVCRGLVAVALRRTPESYTAASLYGKGNSKRGYWSVTPNAYVDSVWMIVFVMQRIEFCDDPLVLSCASGELVLQRTKI